MSTRTMKRSKGSQPPAPASEETKQCKNCKNTFKISEMQRMRLRLPGRGKHVIRHYCKKCFGEKFSECTSCGEKITWKGDFHVLPSGDVICSGCFENNYKTCNECGDIVPADDVSWYDDEPYCQKCVDRFFITCDNCGELVRESDAEEHEGEWFCSSCYEDVQSSDENENWQDTVPLYEAQRAIKMEDVNKAFPDMAERLSRMFARSAWNRTIPARISLKILHGLLPNVKINDDFTYINPIGAVKQLNDLISPKNSIFKALQPIVQTKVTRAIDAIANVKRDVNSLKNDEDDARKQMIDAVRVRMYLDKQEPDAANATNSIVGKYPYPNACNQELMFIITKDPVAIVAKTTSQCWESMSCEKVIRGDFGQGAFSDIANSNAVCYIFDKEIPIARIMIRWCKTNKKKIDLGIEKKWYYCTRHPKTSEKFQDMGNSMYNTSPDPFLDNKITAIKATKFLVAILQSKGFYNDYESCTTPYTYMGYSDTAGNGKTHIRYHK